ncbi:MULTISPECIES: hypothetical protein [unclassified Bacillus (in: firmicutes)]|uniref:hypothetical protein n=1 Tax=unclassified Bacillus (in: firmicutes) TaxID=185979 RepID=UPI0008E9159E|nr:MULTISPECIES: hypothetical protein [unclassified Bacillus (in: firmicutes)]SFA96170.1 hypothetical protein SAMN02799634_103147 [Bacillus sp. UNCCL13]SFQ79640.1 hypothetical protein SAMN04488577_1780 [Bacillus sp. cl95]
MMKPFTETIEFKKEVNSLEQFLCSTGLWKNGEIHWLKDTSDHWDHIGIKTTVEDIESNIRLYSIQLTNHQSHDINLKLLSKHQMKTAGHEHMTFVSPAENVILHFIEHKVILVNGCCQGEGMKQSTTQSSINIDDEIYWSSSEKGILKYQPMAKGKVGSVFSLNVNLQGNSGVRLYTWMIEGETKNEVIQLDSSLLKNRLAFPVER